MLHALPRYTKFAVIYKKNRPHDGYQNLFFQIDLVHELFPESQQIFSLRHPRPSIASFYRLLREPLYDLLESHWEYFWQFHTPLPLNQSWTNELRTSLITNKRPLIEMQALGQAGSLACLYQSRDKLDLVILYEEFIENPQAMLEMIYSKLGIDPGLVNTCLPALETHSQKNYYGVASSKDYDVISKDDWNRLDQIFLTLLPFDTNVELDQFAQTFKANGISG
jgi:hypothetical protein